MKATLIFAIFVQLAAAAYSVVRTELRLKKSEKQGYARGWSDCECWWIEQDAETQKAREEMWRKL